MTCAYCKNLVVISYTAVQLSITRTMRICRYVFGSVFPIMFFVVGYFGLIIVHFSKSQKSSLCIFNPFLLVRPETMEENMILKIFVVFIFPYFKNIFSEVKFFVKSFPII